MPFQINPHYLHGNPPGFKGETREERFREFGALNRRVWVAGLREGTGLRLEGDRLSLFGDGGTCRVFRHGREPVEIAPGDDVQFLLNEICPRRRAPIAARMPPDTEPSVTSINMGEVTWCNADRNGNHDAPPFFEIDSKAP